MKAAFIAIVAALFPVLASAQTAPQPMVAAYQCEIILAADDVPVAQSDWKFEVRAQGESHGGDSRSFAAGTHAIDASADGHWLTLAWNKGGKLVAQGVSCMSPTDFAENRVMILYNPDGSGEQVSVGCSAKY